MSLFFIVGICWHQYGEIIILFAKILQVTAGLCYHRNDI